MRCFASETELPKNADVVVIGKECFQLVIFFCQSTSLNSYGYAFPGGGISGCNALYHLSHRGINAVLIERSKINSGTTCQTAGLVWRLRPDDVGIQLLAASRKHILALQEETGVDPEWVENGGIYVAHNQVSHFLVKRRFKIFAEISSKILEVKLL